MSTRTAQARIDKIEAQSIGDRALARLLELLEADQTGALTIADLRERGVRAPAQGVYTLQLAGYEIDRVSVEEPDGHKTLGYRLNAASVPAQDQVD